MSNLIFVITTRKHPVQCAAVNLLAKWPKATRELVKQNCCVNLSGKEGHGIESDAFVDSGVVQPLKVHSNSLTTVKMSERIMGHISLFKLVRTKYKSKEGFNLYYTSRHSEQSQFPDQLKGAWFCSRNSFFSDKSGAERYHAYHLTRKVNQKKNFRRSLHLFFPKA